MWKLVAALLLCGTLLAAQTETNVQQQKPAPRPAKAPVVSKEKSQQQELGAKLLEIAQAEAGSLQGGMRAYAFAQLARAYEKTDKTKTLQLLDDAFTATSDMGDDLAYTRRQLQEQVLNQMVPLAPQHAEELLPQMDAESRGRVLNSLLSYYQKNKDLDRAIELVYRIGQEKEIPYYAVAGLMTALPPERSGELLQLFTTAFASYRDHPHKGASVGGGGLDSLVLQFWRRLPPNLVHDAIKEILKQAADAGNATLSMSSEKGSATFGSMYEYALFELLPVLKQIDESEAEELLKKNQATQAMLTKYPDGTASISPEVSDPSQKSKTSYGGTSFSITTGGGEGPQMSRWALEQQQVAKIAAEADNHPDNALAQAASVSNQDMRAGLYMTIAKAAAKKSPSVARSALEKLLDLCPQLQESRQVGHLRGAAELYLQMGETDDAKKVVERGFAVSEKLFKTDTNADDPNKALKAFWPSAEAYRSFTRLAGQISPEWALTNLKEISDPEMKVLAETALAQGWLDVGPGSIIMQANTKKNNWMTMSAPQ
jgi:hypothetical protein